MRDIYRNALWVPIWLGQSGAADAKFAVDALQRIQSSKESPLQLLDNKDQASIELLIQTRGSEGCGFFRKPLQRDLHLDPLGPAVAYTV
jgi:hypothetical protein